MQKKELLFYHRVRLAITILQQPNWKVNDHNPYLKVLTIQFLDEVWDSKGDFQVALTSGFNTN
jgi:hypothetical protein